MPSLLIRPGRTQKVCQLSTKSTPLPGHHLDSQRLSDEMRLNLLSQFMGRGGWCTVVGFEFGLCFFQTVIQLPWFPGCSGVAGGRLAGATLGLSAPAKGSWLSYQNMLSETVAKLRDRLLRYANETNFLKCRNIIRENGIRTCRLRE